MHVFMLSNILLQSILVGVKPSIKHFVCRNALTRYVH